MLQGGEEPLKVDSYFGAINKIRGRFEKSNEEIENVNRT